MIYNIRLCFFLIYKCRPDFIFSFSTPIGFEFVVRYALRICTMSVNIASIYGLEKIFSELFPDVLPALPAKSSAFNRHTSYPDVAVLKPSNAAFEAKLEEGRILVDKLSEEYFFYAAEALKALELQVYFVA